MSFGTNSYLPSWQELSPSSIARWQASSHGRTSWHSTLKRNSSLSLKIVQRLLYLLSKYKAHITSKLFYWASSNSILWSISINWVIVDSDLHIILSEDLFQYMQFFNQWTQLSFVVKCSKQSQHFYMAYTRNILNQKSNGSSWIGIFIICLQQDCRHATGDGWHLGASKLLLTLCLFRPPFTRAGEKAGGNFDD